MCLCGHQKSCRHQRGHGTELDIDMDRSASHDQSKVQKVNTRVVRIDPAFRESPPVVSTCVHSLTIVYRYCVQIYYVLI